MAVQTYHRIQFLSKYPYRSVALRLVILVGAVDLTMVLAGVFRPHAVPPQGALPPPSDVRITNWRKPRGGS